MGVHTNGEVEEAKHLFGGHCLRHQVAHDRHDEDEDDVVLKQQNVHTFAPAGMAGMAGMAGASVGVRP